MTRTRNQMARTSTRVRLDAPRLVLGGAVLVLAALLGRPVAAAPGGGAVDPAGAEGPCPPTLDFRFKRLAGDETIHLCREYAGRVVLVVNTASKCAFTPQYEGLEALYQRYRDRGLVVLGFPSNDFGAQEPGSEKQIQEFCRLTYSVKFPMFEKTHAREETADPLYRTLGAMAGEYPRWNFHKYLIDRDGALVASYRSQVSPDDPELVQAIESAL